ncbi:MAG: DUF169 domain-containing protein [Desulfovibrionales bacterium]|nr:DUF169 domain-containing protein [Desulfovibrionales bacterium]
MKPSQVKEIGSKMISILELSGSPVGIKLVKHEDQSKDHSSAEQLTHHRYCQAVMKARHGHSVWLDAEGIACPAAAAAFGFKPLPEPLKTGKGLVGFGIVSNTETGQTMFQNMPSLAQGTVKGLHLMALESCDFSPDVVIVEDEVEKLMWIVLSYMHARGGKRVTGNTAVLQAACVDSTLIPFLEKRLNYGFSCYGCRDATDIRAGETLLGFSGDWLQAIGDHLEYLAEKAIPASRSKKAYRCLQRDDPGQTKACDQLK